MRSIKLLAESDAQRRKRLENKNMYFDHLLSPLCSMAARQRFSNLIERSGLCR